MKTLNVPDMHCEKCVARISNALNEANIPFEIDLASQTVQVAEGNVATAVSEMDDLGFTATEG